MRVRVRVRVRATRLGFQGKGLGEGEGEGELVTHHKGGLHSNVITRVHHMAFTLPSTSFVSRRALCPANSFLIPFSKSDLLVVDVVNKLEGDLRLSSLPAKHFDKAAQKRQNTCRARCKLG